MQHNMSTVGIDLAVAVYDTDIHGTGVSIDATVRLMRLRVKSHGTSS
jgi:hypothetical protein